MKKIKHISAIITLTSFVAFSILFPMSRTASAQISGVPFGGLEVFTFPCTCAAGVLWAHVFFPLFQISVPTGGILVAPPPVIYATYYLRPASWALGTYIPGAGTGCWVGVPPYCVLVPNYGYIMPTTGVSPTV